MPEIVSKTAIKHSEVISVRPTNAFKQTNVKLWELHLITAYACTALEMIVFKLLLNYQNTSQRFPYFKSQFPYKPLRAEQQTADSPTASSTCRLFAQYLQLLMFVIIRDIYKNYTVRTQNLISYNQQL